MEARFAESLVRKWQNIKSQALGPDHRLEKLSEVKIFSYHSILLVHSCFAYCLCMYSSS